jgi:amino acid transporter
MAPDSAPSMTLRLSTRKTSGLVRQVSTMDTARYSITQIAIQFVFLITAAWVLYPGASMEWATVFVVLGSGLVGIVYGLFASVYARSGGEYVFISRALHPLAGFAASFSLTFWMAWSAGTNAAILSIYTLAPAVSALGLQVHSAGLTSAGTFIASHTGLFTIGMVVMVLSTVALIAGMRIYFRAQKWIFVIAGLSLAVTLVVLILGAAHVLNFQSHLDSIAGAGAYNRVIATAAHLGANLHPGFSFGTTLNFGIWPAESLLFGLLAASFAGEVRNPARNQLLGIVGGMVVSGIALVIIELLARIAIGGEFLRASSFVATSDPSKLPLPSAQLPLLISILGGSPVLTVIINLWFVTLELLLPAACIIYSSRCMLAWGIDASAPVSFGQVSQRFRTPTVAIVISFVIGAVTLGLFVYTSLFTVLSALIAQSITFILVAIGGIVFPYRHKRLYEASSAKLTVLGWPLMAVAGVGGTAFLAFMIFRAFVDNNAGVNSKSGLITSGVVFVIGIVWFFVVRMIRKRQGVDLDLRMKEIPIE